ncbi:MAG: sporulation transcriptional regulator SpoIIID [Candidatus Coproplasma sp.]
MWDIHMRILAEAEYIVKTNSTVRATAEHFKISKSTVHKDVTERLEEIDLKLFRQVRAVLEKNLSERHIRGGMATKRKYESRKKL